MLKIYSAVAGLFPFPVYFDILAMPVFLAVVMTALEFLQNSVKHLLEYINPFRGSKKEVVYDG